MECNAITTTVRRRVKQFGNALIRKKKIDDGGAPSKLDRCLNTIDLTALGIGSTLGLGIYVLSGKVASTQAGPSVVVSFAIAALASVFAGLCYAEFGARVPKAGSAYIYSYVTVGEFMAFIIGWNLVLEYVIGTASVARGYSAYLDSLFDGAIKGQFRAWMPMNVTGISAYPDFLAFAITLLLTVMLAIGVKESTRFNSIFTCLNLLIVIYVVIVGAFKADLHNWNLDKDKDGIPKEGGEGGFMPFGFSGMMAGAATCFYGFVGFDVIATTGEEVKNPKKAIPISIVVSLFFIFLAYVGVSSVQTLMWPYYDQVTDAPLPYIFGRVGYPVAKWVVLVGALCGLSTSLLGAMFPLPRVLYAMASDGLIFRKLGEVHPRYKTPLLATIISGIFAGTMAAMFDIKELADMMSIGTLLAYSLVAVSVLMLRFQEDTRNNITCQDNSVNPTSADIIYTPTGTVFRKPVHTFSDYFKQMFNRKGLKTPTELSGNLSTYLVAAIGLILVVFDACLVLFEQKLFVADPLALSIVGVIFLIVLFVGIALACQPRSAKELSFQVPWVPFIPILSMFVNFYLMLKLSSMTWIRFAVWMIIGLLLYFAYGIRESTGHMFDDDKRRQIGQPQGQHIPNGKGCEEDALMPETVISERAPLLSSDPQMLNHVR